MTKNTFAIMVLLFLCASCVLHAVYYYPKLPAEVPSNFNLKGEAHGWTGKTSFIILYITMVAGAALIIPGIGIAMRRMPVAGINLPNKEYWLSPHKKQETFDFLFRHMLWFASGTLLFVMYLFHWCFQAALGVRPSMPKALITGGIYLVFIIAWCAALTIKFSRK